MFHRATGIGSFPHHRSGDALKIIKNNLQYIPHWPQLPRKNPEEGFVRQYLSPLINAEIIKIDNNSRTPFFCSGDKGWEENVLSYFEMMLQWEEDEKALTGKDLSKDEIFFAREDRAGDNPFAFPVDTAEGFYDFLGMEWDNSNAEYLKGQISGPVTVGFQVNSEDGKPAFYDDQLREILVKTLACQAGWQIRRLALCGKPVIIFIDDPSVYGFGTSGYVGLGREAIQKSIGEIAEVIKSFGGIAGVHCCAGADWSILLESPVDIVNFDAYDFFGSMTVYSKELSAFYERGGSLAWGIVPTSHAVNDEDVSSLLNKLSDGISDLVRRGVNEAHLKERLLITPSCGAATLSENETERVYNLLKELEARLGDL